MTNHPWGDEAWEGLQHFSAPTQARARELIARLGTAPMAAWNLAARVAECEVLAAGCRKLLVETITALPRLSDVRAHERERCAKVADTYGEFSAGLAIAKAIRALPDEEEAGS